MKVQEALQSAIDAMIMYQLKLDSTFIDEAIISCKSALSDIEKCEPECNVEGTWLWLKLMGYCNKKGIAPATQNELFAIAGEAHKLYTSPISKECEPVGELILDPALLPALKSPLVNWKINLVDLEVGAKFYTSSISKEREPINEVYEFEKWLKENTLIRANLTIDLDYADPLAEIAYRAWKARAKLNTEKG